MIVKPAMIAKQFADASAGELVRTAAFQTPLVCLVAEFGKPRADDQKVLIALTADANDDQPPRYMVVGADLGVVLSYGRAYEFVADQSPEAIDVGAARLWGLNGALVLTETASLLRVAPARGCGHATIHYDIGSGRIVEEPRTSDVVLIGKWELRLAPEEGSERPGPTLVSFSHQFG